ncbi:MAG: hypothetical protein EBS06_01110 [Proteobacteria bacterium]|nr:hypothetical protein [Pseudomonadota bacterium]
MTSLTNTDFTELCQTLSKIFNTTSLEIQEHLSLFIKIDPTIKNCLYYLSQIEEDDLKISAALSLEFLVKFKKSPFN